MGYDTHFEGQIDIVPPLSLKEFNKITKFIEKRHSTQHGAPGSWCGWELTEDGDAIIWDGVEKFSEGAEWMKYLIEYNIGKSYTLNGTIEAMGEEHDDRWDLIVKDNKVFVLDYDFAPTTKREV